MVALVCFLMASSVSAVPSQWADTKPPFPSITVLNSSKLATSEPYRSIFLTNEGKKLAAISKEKHNIVYQFLIKLGVSKKVAQYDSEGIEHHVSDETLKLMKNFSK